MSLRRTPPPQHTTMAQADRLVTPAPAQKCVKEKWVTSWQWLVTPAPAQEEKWWLLLGSTPAPAQEPVKETWVTSWQWLVTPAPGQEQ